MSFKHCNKCTKTKPLSEFNPRGDKQAGVRAHCKKCSSKGNALRRRKKLGPKRQIMTETERKEAAKRYQRKFAQSMHGRAVKAAAEARYRASKLQATPKWLTDYQKEGILVHYQTASALTDLFGIQMDVDHIIPLRGKNVSGLHVPWNLCILAHKANQLKSNKVISE